MINKKDKYKYSNLPIEKINLAFINACCSGDLEVIKYLLFDKYICNVDMHKWGEVGVISACHKNHNHVVKFLLDSNNLTKPVSINVNHGELLYLAVKNHNVDLLNYLLGKKNTKIHLNQNNDSIFKMLMGNYQHNRKMIMSLIADYNLPRTEEIDNFLDQKNYGIEEKKIVKRWFEQREAMEMMHYIFTEDDKKEVVKPKKVKV